MRKEVYVQQVGVGEDKGREGDGKGWLWGGWRGGGEGNRKKGQRIQLKRFCSN